MSEDNWIVEIYVIQDDDVDIEDTRAKIEEALTGLDDIHVQELETKKERKKRKKQERKQRLDAAEAVVRKERKRRERKERAEREHE